jgi:hypothetical protein
MYDRTPTFPFERVTKIGNFQSCPRSLPVHLRNFYLECSLHTPTG